MKCNFEMKMKVIRVNPENPELKTLQEAADVILGNGVIGYPTETVYGLGANALSDTAVEKVFELKQREKNKPILIIVSDLNQIMGLISFFPEIANSVTRHFWPGPLTIIFKAALHLAKPLLGTGNTIGIRIPDNRICLELLQLCGVPLTSTSANLSGRNNPVCVDEVITSFGDRLNLIIDGGIARSRISSTVLDLSKDEPVLIREGIIHKKTIEQTIGFKINEIKKEK